jgi:hypothetical protein
MNRAVTIATVALAVAAASPAGAQCRLCANPTTSVEERGDEGKVTVEIETSLSFDRLILFGQGQGTAIIRPDGSSSAAGAVADVSPRAMVGSAVVHGEPSRMVRVEMPRRIILHSFGGGGEISFDDVVSDLPSLPRLDSTGKLSFHFGGRLTITGNADGDYRGDLPITVEYL